MNARQNRVLGKGLSALISGAAEGAAAAPSGEAGSIKVPIAAIGLNPGQPRKTFNSGTLNELADSIRQVGVLQPVLIRRLRRGEPRPLSMDQRLVAETTEGGKEGGGAAAAEASLEFCLVAGERRLRAAHLAGHTEIPALVCTYEQTEALKVALLENIQREDLNPIEEASTYQQLLDEYGATQEELAGMLGKSRSGVANTMRLLSLDPEIQELVRTARLSRGHAKALLGVGDLDARLRLARLCVSRGLSVRDCEQRVNALQGSAPAARGRRRSRAKEESREIRALRERTEQAMGSPVRIDRNAAGKGEVAIRFFSDDDLTRILAKLGVDTDLS